MKVPVKDMTLKEYYEEFIYLRGGKNVAVTYMNIPDNTYKRISTLSKMNGTRISVMISHLLTLATLLYDIDTLMIPILRVKDETEIDNREDK
jgi:hypothetical protein